MDKESFYQFNEWEPDPNQDINKLKDNYLASRKEMAKHLNELKDSQSITGGKCEEICKTITGHLNELEIYAASANDYGSAERLQEIFVALWQSRLLYEMYGISLSCTGFGEKPVGAKFQGYILDICKMVLFYYDSEFDGVTRRPPDEQP